MMLKSYRRFHRDVTCNHHQASTIPRLSSALRALVGALNALHILHSEHDSNVKHKDFNFFGTRSESGSLTEARWPERLEAGCRFCCPAAQLALVPAV